MRPQLETSQIPVEARVSSEPVKMQTGATREGLIHLDLVATDRRGKPLSGLTAQDLTLMDSGVPQKIVSFAAPNQANDENGKLTELVLVMDEVNLSPTQSVPVMHETVRFLRQNGGHLDQPASVYWFTPAGLYASASPTNDGTSLAQDVLHHQSRRTLWSMPRHSSLLAESQAARQDASLRVIYSIAVERRKTAGRKLLLWMGIGWPSVSDWGDHKDSAFSYLVELSTRIRDARMVIDQISTWDSSRRLDFTDEYREFLPGVRAPSELNKQGKDPSVHAALPVLATQSGGVLLNESTDIAESITRCVEGARQFYTISFDPPNAKAPDEYHELQAAIATPEVLARTTTGYYNQPSYYDQPFLPSQRISVAELEQLLRQAGDQQDDALAKQLDGLETRPAL